MCAVAGGRSLETSMGFTPLEGLMMGTRCGEALGLLHSGPGAAALPPAAAARVASARPGSGGRQRGWGRRQSIALAPCHPCHPCIPASATQPGDIDPAIPPYLMGRGFSPEALDELMNKKSGFLGLAGAHAGVEPGLDAAALAHGRGGACGCAMPPCAMLRPCTPAAQAALQSQLSLSALPQAASMCAPLRSAPSREMRSACWRWR